MAKVYANAAGEILRFLGTGADEELYPTPPPGTAFTVAFDEDTNEDVVLALHAYPDEHDCAGGVLRRDGQAVTLAPPSPEYNDRQQLATYFSNLQTYMGLDTPTGAQTVGAVKILIRLMRLIFRLLRRMNSMGGPRV